MDLNEENVLLSYHDDQVTTCDNRSESIGWMFSVNIPSVGFTFGCLEAVITIDIFIIFKLGVTLDRGSFPIENNSPRLIRHENL